MPPYTGPLRHEPLALELLNTRYASEGAIVDALGDADATRAWLEGITPRLPIGGSGAGPTSAELVDLRERLRDVLHWQIAGKAPTRAGLDAINEFSRRAPLARVARWQRGAAPTLALDVGDATRADVVLSAFAADAVELLTGPESNEIRACGAPGCVLLFLRSHPRREWCSAACGNRARQARHYARTRSG